ncbi:hypothetical protein GQ43DRAFT_470795 [Delitschia confertaspora ATCC 74209]|uniref:F-box domain-containing protein n=1 Tax=Delitschia confertaspora ATCC 74209 TaxID=1513339 RepID=A0A9P4JN58_9PLEO|nr:hypothetical protein GQ43DRAFT_470795 [Delitschia confertaspora ATCC 74209]
MARNNGLDNYGVIVGVVSIPIAVLRFAIFIPFAAYFGRVSKHWNVIKKHVELQSAPYSPNYAKSARLGHAWGKYGFYWNFVVWIPHLCLPPPFSLIFGILDTAITVMLSISNHDLSPLVPHSTGACKNGGAEKWQVSNGTKSFFTLAGELNSTKATPFKMCKSYVEEWQYGLSIVTIYGTIAGLNILLSMLICVILLVQTRRKSQNMKSWAWENLLSLPRLFFMVFIIITWIPVALFRCCLPTSWKAKARYGRRYAMKASQQAVSKSKEIKMKAFQGEKETTSRYENLSGEGKPTNLADFLCYDILMIIVEDLHYVDVMNLARVSKSVREAVLPATDYARRIQHFKRYSCPGNPSSKTECWVCTNQVCDGCSHTRSLNHPHLFFHLSNCTPYCSTCYTTRTLSSTLHAKPRLQSPRCKCEPPTSTPNVFQTWWRGKAYYDTHSAPSASSYLPRMVCTTCVGKSDTEILELRKKRTERELGDSRRVGKCGSCAVNLRTKEVKRGPVWWVCKKCLKECTSAYHAPWGKGRESDEEVALD